MSENLLLITRLIIIGVTETWYVHFSLSELTGYKPRRSKGYAAMLAVYFLLTVFDAFNDFPIYFVFTLAYVLITITVQLFFKGPDVLKLGVPFVSIAINYSATLFASTLTWIFQNDAGVGRFSTNLKQNITSQVLLILISVALILLISRGWREKHSAANNILTVAVLPMAMIMLLIGAYYRGKAATTNPQDLTIDNCIIGILLFFISVTFFSLTTTSSSFTLSKDYSNTLEQMISMQAKYYSDLERHQVELRKINHDIKNHTRMMDNMLKAGQLDELQEYIHVISDYVSGVASPVTKCDNMLINALLNDKLSKVKQNGVKLNLCVMVPEDLEINNVDMCIVLGNMLDNAVDACVNMSDDDDKFIEVDIRVMNAFLVIKIANSYSVPINMRNQEYITTKKDKQSHGLGLKNIRRIVDKYDGRLNIKHTENTFTITAYLTYPMIESN